MLAMFCISVDCRADSSFRCGTQLVRLDDSRNDVIRKCGEPTSVESWEEERIQRDFKTGYEYAPGTTGDEWSREPFLVKVHVKIELWTYNPGPTQFIRHLRFENGILRDITTGAKGY